MNNYPIIIPVESNSGPMTESDVKLLLGVLIILNLISLMGSIYYRVKEGHWNILDWDNVIVSYIVMMTLLVDGVMILGLLGEQVGKLF